MQGHHYSVNDKKFYNYYTALRYSKEVNSFAEYVIPQWHVDAFASVHVPSILNRDPQFYMQEKIQWIIKNYDTHRLFYTGGTDSHTILQLAEKLNVCFTHSMTALSSVRNDPYVDEEYMPGLAYLEFSDAVVKKEVFRPTVEHFEKLWKDAANFFDQRGAYFSFRPIYTDIILKDRDQTQANINGHFKPKIVFNRGHYYLFALGVHDEYMGLPEEISFFGDGIIPELAVQQAYLSLHFIKHCAPHSKKIDMTVIPYNLREQYNQTLGRTPSLNKKISIGTILGKSDVLNEKNHRSMKEIIDIGRKDIVDSWNETRLKLLDILEDIPYGIETPLGKCAVDNWQENHKIIKRVNRLGFVFRMDPDRLRIVSAEDAFD